MTRSINGTGWAVMADQESVQKAVDYFNTGEVFILGSASSILTTQHIVFGLKLIGRRAEMKSARFYQVRL